MNLPNWITFSRLLLIIPFLALLEFPGWEFVATVVFIVACLTDWVDGFLARRMNLVSELGALMDPLVDKVLVTGALVALASRGLIPAWSVTAVLFREFLVTGIRAIEAKRGVIIPAGTLGKWKAATQMVALIMLMWAIQPPPILAWSWLQPVGMWTYWLAVVLTMVSGIQYLWLARGLFSEEPRPA